MFQDAVRDEAHRGMVWAHPGVTSWYKNRHNRVTVTSPWTLLDYWTLTRHYEPAAYRSERRDGSRSVAAA